MTLDGVGYAAVDKRNSDCVGDCAFCRIQIVGAVGRVFGDKHFFSEGVDVRVFCDGIFVVGGV